MSDEQKYFSVNQAAKKLKMTKYNLYYHLDQGHIDSVVVADRRVLTQECIDKWLNERAELAKLKTAEEYCKEFEITRNQFNYRVKAGFIKTFKKFGHLYVDENWM